MRRAQLCLAALIVLLWVVPQRIQAEDAPVGALLAAAKAGQVVQLPAGTFAEGDLHIPAGVSVQGAGYEKTVLDASGHANGLLVDGARGVSISALTVRGAQGAGVVVRNAQAFTLSRVKLLHNDTGLLISNSSGVHVENAILAENHTGVSLAQVSASSLANCTIADSTDVAAIFADLTNVTVFNTLFAQAPLALDCRGSNSKCMLDDNFYATTVIGKQAGETPRATLPSWQALSGYDAHSVALPVAFADTAHGDYHPVTALAWVPARATTSDWGSEQVGKVLAPLFDIDGHPRICAPDVGAYETALPTDHDADGTFDINIDAGVTSAGLYRKDGVRVALLFQNLPLRRGAYPFYLPAHDDLGQPIPDGDYELRVVQSELKSECLGAIGIKPSPQVAAARFVGGKFAGDDDMRLWSPDREYAIVVDSKHRHWEVDHGWQLPTLPYSGQALGFFSDGKHNFAVYPLSATDGSFPGTGLVVIEFQGHAGKARTFYRALDKGIGVLHDTHGDGVIDLKATPTPLLAPDGTPLPFIGIAEAWLDPRGALLCDQGPKMVRVNFGGIDAQGFPVYDWAHPQIIMDISFIQYDDIDEYQTLALSDGGYVVVNHDHPLANPAETTHDAVVQSACIDGLDQAGQRRWRNACAGIAEVQALPGYPVAEKKRPDTIRLLLAMSLPECNYQVLDEDGLGLGVLGQPRAAHWSAPAPLSTSPAPLAWIGNDDQPYYMLYNKTLDTYQWFHITGANHLQRTKIPVHVKG